MRTAAVTHSENYQPTQRQPCRPNRANKFHLCVVCRCLSEVFTLKTVVVTALCKMLQKTPSDRKKSAKRPEKKRMENFSICRRTEMLLPAFLVFPLFNFPLYHHHRSVGRSVVIRVSRSYCQHSSTNRPTNRLNLSQKKKKLFIQLSELNVIIVVVSSLSHSNSCRWSAVKRDT